jgi:hypothetical protein
MYSGSTLKNPSCYSIHFRARSLFCVEVEFGHVGVGGTQEGQLLGVSLAVGQQLQLANLLEVEKVVKGYGWAENLLDDDLLHPELGHIANIVLDHELIVVLHISDIDGDAGGGVDDDQLLPLDVEHQVLLVAGEREVHCSRPGLWPP